MPREPGLVISGVGKTYRSERGAVAAVAGMDLEVPRGHFVTVIGPSGCGKSTLLHMLAGADRPDAGEISIFGESVDHARRAKHIGYVPQSLALLPWRTVLGNTQLPLELNRPNRAEDPELSRGPTEVLSALGLGAVLHRYPAELSGGMRQRVAIARAFVHEPALLLMDEPFSALDELTSEVLRRELIELWQTKRTTVLFVSHSIPEAVLLSDEVVVMTHAPGKVAAVVAVPLPRPRGNLIEVTPEFREIEREIRLAFHRLSSTTREAG
ncbi:MAG TPA: ABC transporter ATP-binding protein [Acidimicrobiales bacterium]|nr:ABC transporter ATP-binding protein [Acidimicrobiales bacterium]